MHLAIGQSESKSINVSKLKSIIKTSCDTIIGGCVSEDRKWVLQAYNLQHNYGLSLDKTMCFPYNRSISVSTKKRIEMNDCARTNIASNFNYIIVESGVNKNVSFKKKRL